MTATDDASATPTGAGRVIVITGVMAAGKSTIAEMLAGALAPRSVHIRGDAFRKMIVNGRADMTPQPSPDATAQLTLRYELAAHTADQFAARGFDAIVQDVIIGPELPRFIARIRSPQRYLVVLSPSVSAIEVREQERTKQGYTSFTPHALDQVLRAQTPQLGYWLDSSAQRPSETVADILDHLPQARIADAPVEVVPAAPAEHGPGRTEPGS